MKLLVSIALALMLSGCAIMADGIYFASRNHQGSAPTGSITRESTRTDGWTTVRLEPNGEVTCHNALRHYSRSNGGEVRTTTSNGIRLMSALFTFIDAAIVGVAVWLHQTSCSQPMAQCGFPDYFYLGLTPVYLDFGWALTRWITVSPEMYRELLFQPSSEEHPARVEASEEPCPVGTGYVVTDANSGSSFSLRFDVSGHLEAHLLAEWMRFLLDRGGSFELRGADDLRVSMDRTALLPAMAAASAQLNALATARPQPTMGPPQNPSVIVDTPGVVLGPIPVCTSDAMCTIGFHCRNRGDGASVCMGVGAPHPFCSANTDCPSNLQCVHRVGDRIGFCTPR